MPIPEVELRIMCQQTNPPKPIGVDVVSDGRVIGVVSLDAFLEAGSRVEALLEAWRAARR